MADLHTSIVEQVLNVSKGQGEPHVEHHCQADHLRAGLEMAEGGVFCHLQAPGGRPATITTGFLLAVP